MIVSVSWILDVYPGSEFFHLDPDPHHFNPKIFSKLSKICSGMFIPDSDLYFLPIPDTVVEKAPDPQHWFEMFKT